MDNPAHDPRLRAGLPARPDASDASQLNAYAGVLDEVGDAARCEEGPLHLCASPATT